MLGINWSTFSPAHYFHFISPKQHLIGGGGLQKNPEHVIKSELKDKTLYFPNEFAHDSSFKSESCSIPFLGTLFYHIARFKFCSVKAESNKRAETNIQRFLAESYRVMRTLSLAKWAKESALSWREIKKVLYCLINTSKIRSKYFWDKWSTNPLCTSKTKRLWSRPTSSYKALKTETGMLGIASCIVCQLK